MSRRYKFEKTTESAVFGSPVGEFEVELDLSLEPSSKDVMIHDDFSLGGHQVSCQAVATDLTSSLDGSLQLIQSNNGEDWAVIDVPTNLDTNNNSVILEKDHFNCKYIGVRVTKGSIASGVVKLYFVIKHN